MSPSLSQREGGFSGLHPWLGSALIIVALFDVAGIVWGLKQTGHGFTLAAAIHLAAAGLGFFTVCLFRGGFTFGIFTALLGLVLPGAGHLAAAALIFSLRGPAPETPRESAWIRGNPSRHRLPPDAPGLSLNEGGDPARGDALWLRHAASRKAVSDLTLMRDSADPFTSLYASGALEARFSSLENRISRLRARVKTAPDDHRSRRHLAEALIYLAELLDPEAETGEPARLVDEARTIFVQMGIVDAKLAAWEGLKAAEKKARKADWHGVATALPPEAPLSLRQFWKGEIR